MNIGAVQPKIDASAIPLEKLSGNSNVSDADKAKEVARQFEAVMVRQILKSAQQTGVKGLLEDSSASKDVYFDMMNYHMADAITRGGGVGLASAFQAQLQSQMTVEDSNPSETDDHE